MQPGQNSTKSRYTPDLETPSDWHVRRASETRGERSRRFKVTTRNVWPSGGRRGSERPFNEKESWPAVLEFIAPPDTGRPMCHCHFYPFLMAEVSRSIRPGVSRRSSSEGVASREATATSIPAAVAGRLEKRGEEAARDDEAVEPLAPPEIRFRIPRRVSRFIAVGGVRWKIHSGDRNESHGN